MVDRLDFIAQFPADFVVEAKIVSGRGLEALEAEVGNVGAQPYKNREVVEHRTGVGPETERCLVGKAVQGHDCKLHDGLVGPGAILGRNGNLVVASLQRLAADYTGGLVQVETRRQPDAVKGSSGREGLDLVGNRLCRVIGVSDHRLSGKNGRGALHRLQLGKGRARALAEVGGENPVGGINRQAHAELIEQTMPVVSTIARGAETEAVDGGTEGARPGIAIRPESPVAVGVHGSAVAVLLEDPVGPPALVDKVLLTDPVVPSYACIPVDPGIRPGKVKVQVAAKGRARLEDRVVVEVLIASIAPEGKGQLPGVLGRMGVERKVNVVVDAIEGKSFANDAGLAQGFEVVGQPMETGLRLLDQVLVRPIHVPNPKIPFPYATVLGVLGLRKGGRITPKGLDGRRTVEGGKVDPEGGDSGRIPLHDLVFQFLVAFV